MKATRKRKARREVVDYDEFDTSEMIDEKKRLTFEDLGLKLPPAPSTQVISIRLPSKLLNEIRAHGSERDVPYQALIKLWLAEAVEQRRRKKAA